MNAPLTIAEMRAKLIKLAKLCRKDPLLFVQKAFPWGHGMLRGMSGPDKWQTDLLTHMKTQLESGATMEEVVRIAIASGHGIGKSATVAWVILWSICTFPDTRGVVTANTDTQLRTKTWAELAKWYHLCVFRPWFELTATAIISKQPGHDKTWRIDAIPWSESNPEAFAGLHNQGKRILVIFDEASAIHDKIWEVIEGAMTDRDTEIFWICFGNPTRNVGRFYDCFGRLKKRWKTWHIDSRTVAISNKSQLTQWVEDYGEESDFVKVRVRGLFPSSSSNQLIPRHLVESAIERPAPEHNPMLSRVGIIGVDVARFGDDSSAIACRCGLDLFRLEKHYGLDGYELGYKVAALYDELMMTMGFEKVYIFVDTGGVGASPQDYLMHHGYSHCTFGVNFGSAADNKAKYKNKRSEMWGEMRDWLADGSIVNNDVTNELLEDLISPEYFITPTQQIQLEPKDDIKERIGRSPDVADCVALTFAQKVHIPIKDNYPMSRMSQKAKESRNARRW